MILFKGNIRIKKEHVVNTITLAMVILVLLSGPTVPFLIRGQGYSMYPTITHDSLVVAVPFHILRVFGYEPKDGDIIVFKAPAVPPVWCHRIVGRINGAYVTKGDNNPVPDPFLVEKKDVLAVVPQIFGKPITIPKVGFLVGLLNSNPLITTLFVLGIVVIPYVIQYRHSIESSSKEERDNGKKSIRFVFIVALIIVAFTLSFFTAAVHSGFTHIFYQVDDAEGMLVGNGHPLNFGVVKVNTEATRNVTIRNGGFLPVVAYVTLMKNPYHDVEVCPTRIIILPFSEATIQFRVYGKNVHEMTVLPVAISVTSILLPAEVVFYLLRIHPFIPVIVHSLLSAAIPSITFITINNWRNFSPHFHILIQRSLSSTVNFLFVKKRTGTLKK
ncbi:MAG TPA: signal peptidase I [Candidatus Bathyarchaeota archaeon]|nr:signal peptidase I [Candidatus Bathyarchaeota archaeon]